MFSKKCPSCENKIKKDFKYCPFCSSNLNSKYDQEDYGFLGKEDTIDNINFTDSFMEKMFNSALKILEKQMKNLQNETAKNHNPSLNVQFFVNGEKISPEKKTSQPASKPYFPKEKLKRFSQLPKKEPKSKLKRISGKIIYELSVPGVKNIDDVLINQLENSIEIKALSNDKVYSKNLNLNLPILRYQLYKDNLVIEMQAK